MFQSMKTLVMCSKNTSTNTKNLCNHVRGLVDGVKDDNFDSKSGLHELIDMMDMNECESVIYFETTKRAMSLWLATLKGPTVKLRIDNFLDMRYFKESVFIENGTLLSFSKDFEDGNLNIFKNIVMQIFGNDKPKDRIATFFYLNDLIEMRVYRIDNNEEVGPRMNISIFKILKQCFSGETLFPERIELK